MGEGNDMVLTQNHLRRMRLFLCKLGFHCWNYFQEIFVTHTNHEDKYKVVIAFNICDYCAKFKLIHILK
jgi:hypothetical protein